VDGRFDDLLAMMQVGTSGPAKMEIAGNFWDEMGNGNDAEVHTHLFNNIFKVFDIDDEELERSLTANALLSGKPRGAAVPVPAASTRRRSASSG